MHKALISHYISVAGGEGCDKAFLFVITPAQINLIYMKYHCCQMILELTSYLKHAVTLHYFYIGGLDHTLVLDDVL